MTKTQIDRLGDRLKKGNISDDDLRLLDSYRRSFSEAYEFVVGSVREKLALEPTGRPAKSTTSIADKLRRESIRLTQIQDIAGCRLIASDIANQESVVQSLESLFEDVTIVDRRQKPSHGYRAVHVIVNRQGKMIEIQVRTSLQHLWAELSEKFSDVVDLAIKYGEGNEVVQKILAQASIFVIETEAIETQLAELNEQLFSKDNLTDDEGQGIARVQEKMHLLKQTVFKYLRDYVEAVEELEGENDDLPD